MRTGASVGAILATKTRTARIAGLSASQKRSISAAPANRTGASGAAAWGKGADGPTLPVRQGPGQRVANGSRRERLRHVVASAQPHRFHARGKPAVSGKNDGEQVGTNEQGPLQHRQAVHDRHAQAGKENVKGLLLQQGKPFLTVGGQRNLRPFAAKDVRQHITDAGIRINHQDLRARHRSPPSPNRGLHRDWLARTTFSSSAIPVESQATL